MNLTRARLALGVVSLTLLSVSSASAQVFGTFAWQMQPYCNTVTLTLTNSPAGFVLEGTDNQCGGPNVASAVGVASFNAGGLVNVNFTIVTAPSGKAVHVAAIVSPATGSGTWTDSVGNTGNFALGSPGSGSPRPLPTSGVGPATITAVELAPNAVGAAQIAANAVTGSSVADGSLTMADIANGPRAAFAGGEQALNLTASSAVVRSVTITAPAAGVVIANASGQWQANSTTLVDAGRCSITTGNFIDLDQLHVFGEETGSSVGTKLRGSISVTRGFNVVPGAFTVNFVCNEFSGDTAIFDSSMSAMYFPG